MRAAILFTALALSTPTIAASLRIQPGVVYKVRCEGRLLISAIGNDALVQMEALPKETGCGLILKARASQGVTNLIAETSTGTVRRVIEVGPGPRPSATDLEVSVTSEEGGK